MHSTPSAPLCRAALADAAIDLIRARTGARRSAWKRRQRWQRIGWCIAALGLAWAVFDALRSVAQGLR